MNKNDFIEYCKQFLAIIEWGGRQGNSELSATIVCPWCKSHPGNRWYDNEHKPDCIILEFKKKLKLIGE